LLKPSLFSNFSKTLRINQKINLPKLTYLKKNIIKIFFLKKSIETEEYFNKEIFFKNLFIFLPNIILGFYSNLLRNDYKVALNLNKNLTEYKLQILIKKLLNV
jgi:hypothetical protein